MDLITAKRIIADYLTGRCVTQEELKEAWQALQSDREYLDYLKNELGLGDDFMSDCVMFRARAAEFSDMSDIERRREMPEMATHLEMCRTCRRFLWTVQRPWRIVRGGEPARAVKRLSEFIGVVVGLRGVREFGLGIPPIRQEVLAVAAGTGADDETSIESAEEEVPGPELEWKEWSFPDEEAGCSIWCLISRLAEGRVGVQLGIRSEEGLPTDNGAYRVEVREADREVSILKGLLRDFAGRGFTLEAGSWLIRIIPLAATESVVWEIPLEVRGSGSVGRS
jgi:hypothetical protein